jgi:ATP-dependent RNA helicase DeaD
MKENSPESFSELVSDPSLLAKLDSLGIQKPTPVQSQAIPSILDGNDCIIQAQTGSGKTYAFVLPLLKRLEKTTQSGSKSTQALIIAPTRELAIQISDVITTLNTAFSPNLLIGGTDQTKQERTLANDPRIVVGTPGRILDFIKQKLLRLKDCGYFVLDEADEMLSMGFIEDIRAILSRLPDKRQGIFISATITPRVEMIAHSFLTRPQRISVDSYKSDTPKIDHCYCEVSGELLAKPTALCDLIETLRPRSAIIFCNTKSDTQLVEALLRRRGFDARRINSDLSQSQRQSIIKKIRQEELQFLVATDVAARGLDIEQIDLVINYTIHEQPETYIHRTGRTGRAGRSGKAISIIGPKDFGAFHYLTKVVDFSFNKIETPSDEEVAGSRLPHIYEIIRTSNFKISERELLTAKKLLTDLGNIEDPTEELIESIAKLCQFALERSLNIDAKSLEEELENTSEDFPREKEAHSPSKHTQKEHHKEHLPRKQDRQHASDPREKGDRNPSNKSKPEKQRPEKQRDSRKEPRREEGRQQTRESKRREPRENNASTSTRLYIGQGTADKMTIDNFLDLVTEFTGLGEEHLQNLVMRKHYGFVDANPEDAKIILKNLSGIEHNNHPLVVEEAAVIEHNYNQRRTHNR